MLMLIAYVQFNYLAKASLSQGERGGDMEI